VVISTAEFEHDLRDLTAADFEQLGYTIVLKQHPRAQKLKAPDFGADVLDDAAAKKPRVWQVKHFTDKPNWTLCRESLDRAVKKWKPTEVTFVFPRDLTGKDHQDFTDKLVTESTVPVDRWTASRLNEELEKYPAVRRSYFPHRTELAHEILRAAKLADRPVDGPAFLKHGADLAGLIEELDPHFDYELRSRPDRLPAASWDQPPFMTATLRGEGRESVIAAFVKPGAAPPEVFWSFTADDAGDDARLSLYKALARREKINLSEGVVVQASSAPRAIKEIMDDAPQHMEGTSVLTIQPSKETVPVTVVIEGTAALQRRLDFEMRSAPPNAGEDGAWVGLAAGVLLYLGFTQTGPNSVRFEVSPTLDLGASAGQNAVATSTMLDLLSYPLKLEGPLFPKEAALDLSAEMEEDGLDPLRFLHDAYTAMIEIEARTGTPLWIPETLGSDAAVSALNLAALLRDGRTTGRSHMKTTLHVAPEQGRQVTDRLVESRQLTVPFEQDLAQQVIRHGWARITYERLSVTVIPPDPNGLVGLRIEAGGDVEIQLIEQPLPSDVALDLATGKWNTAVI
jgi:hypothetical protein